MPTHELGWQSNAIHCMLGDQIRCTLTGMAASLQPNIQLTRQGHGMGGNHEAADPLSILATQGFVDFFHEQSGPEPLDGSQAAQMFACLGPGRAPFGNASPQGALLLAILLIPAQLIAAGGEPFGLAGEGAAPAFLRCLAKAALSLGGGHNPFGQVEYSRVQHAGIWLEKSAFPVPAGFLLPFDVLLQNLPGIAVE